MKTKVLYILLAVAMVFASCTTQKPEPEPKVTVRISEFQSFYDSEASVTLVLSKALTSDVTVTLAPVQKSVEDLPALPADSYVFETRVTIPAGSLTKEVEVALLTLPEEDSVAAIEIAAAEGAEPGEPKVAYIRAKAFKGIKLQLQDNWSVSLPSLAFPEDCGLYWLINIDMKAPGIGYFNTAVCSDSELVENYEGSVEVLYAYMQAEIMAHIAEGSPITPLFTLDDEEIFTYWYEAGKTKIYLFEFDENGIATGRYGISSITMPEADDDWDWD